MEIMKGNNFQRQSIQEQAINCVNMTDWEDKTRAEKSLSLCLEFRS